MSCSPFELRDYFLKELPESEVRQVEAHVKSCQPCREELDRLRITEAALCTLRDEEIPQRIAFISDKVFEPSPIRRWLAGFWGSAARLGFASAVILAVAIVVRPVSQAPAPSTAVPVLRTVSDADIQARIDAAVVKAVARQDERATKLMADLEDTRRRLLIAAAEFEYSQKRSNELRAANYSLPMGDSK
jgi:anti-sigma factor RsiW